MHKDHKQKRAAIIEIQDRELRQPKRVDQRALEKFRAKPYQLEYAEMIGGLKNELGRQSIAEASGRENDEKGAQ